MARKCLLVVDDEETIRDIFREYFGGLGYDVVTAQSGKDAIQKFTPGRFDCVISDLVMPEMDGLDFLHQLRSIDKKIAFLMMTGYPSVESAIDAVKHGAYDYISKPLNLEDVRVKVERALHTRSIEKSLKTVNGLLWAVIVSVPIWLALGILLGMVWKKF
jgi:DNA-binding NtrC family response regulator